MKAVDRTTRDLGKPEAKDAFDAVHQLQLHVDDAIKSAKDEIIREMRAGFEQLNARLDARDTLPSSPSTADLYRLATRPPPRDLTPPRRFWSLLRFW